MRTFHDHDVAPLIQALIAFVGQDSFAKCLATWRNSLLNARPIERVQADQSAFYWWPGLAHFAQWQPGMPHAPATLLLAKDAIKLLDLLTTMPDSVKKEFAGALGAYLKAPGHLHELSMAHHLAQIGCQIRWFEHAGGGIPEFLAIRPDLAFEVECKRISVDAGRQLARGAFARFADEIIGAVRRRKLMGRVHVVLTRRLPAPAQQAQIAASLGAALDAGHYQGSIALLPWGQAELALQPADDGVVDWEAAQADARAQHAPELHAVVHGQPVAGGAANLIRLTTMSMERSAYLRTIYKTMKAAARDQLSGNHPGLLCIHIPEIRDFTGLLEDSALKDMTAYFFSQVEHAHVFAVAYTSDTRVMEESTGFQFTADALAFKNAGCKFPEAFDFRLFPHEVIAPLTASSAPPPHAYGDPDGDVMEPNSEQP